MMGRNATSTTFSSPLVTGSIFLAVRFLHRTCCERSAVDAIRIEGAHRLVQFSRRGRLFHDAIEVADVFAGFFDDPRVVVVAHALVVRSLREAGGGPGRFGRPCASSR